MCTIKRSFGVYMEGEERKWNDLKVKRLGLDFNRVAVENILERVDELNVDFAGALELRHEANLERVRVVRSSRHRERTRLVGRIRRCAAAHACAVTIVASRTVFQSFYARLELPVALFHARY